MSFAPLTAEQVHRFKEDGYLFVPEFYDAEEMELLLQVAKADMEKTEDVRGPVDAAGGQRYATVHRRASMATCPIQPQPLSTNRRHQPPTSSQSSPNSDSRPAWTPSEWRPPIRSPAPGPR